MEIINNVELKENLENNEDEGNDNHKNNENIEPDEIEHNRTLENEDPNQIETEQKNNDLKESISMDAESHGKGMLINKLKYLKISIEIFLDQKLNGIV